MNNNISIIEISSDDENNNDNDTSNIDGGGDSRLKITKTKRRYPSLQTKVLTAAKRTRKDVNSTKRKANTATVDLEENQELNAHIEGVATRASALNSENNTNTINRQLASLHYQYRQQLYGWTVADLLAEKTSIPPTSARNIVNLLENEHTIPFICRYRRDLINHLEPERLREIKNSYHEIINLRKKIDTTITLLSKENAINEQQRMEIMRAKNTDELEFLSAPFKPANKGTLADRAKSLGLEMYADRLLYGTMPQVDLNQLVNCKNPALNTEEKVLSGICNIISHNIGKNSGVLEELRHLRDTHRIILKSTKAKNTKSLNSTSSKVKQHGKRDIDKYEQYFEFQSDVKYLKPHQILAINRADDLKILTIKIVLPDSFKTAIQQYVYNVFMTTGITYDLRTAVFQRSFDECFVKKLRPLVNRQIRSSLNELAVKASIDVFGKNLKQLLLMSPVKGERILGIDPGFINGCKYALISETADVLETGVFYPHQRNSDPEQCGEQLSKTLIKNKCKLIALGNGSACRETELWLTKLYDLDILDRNVIRYCIVSEQGASIYSCSDLASKEFPNIDINQISAVSIARRLNDPLSEYVKIEPRHIGVGMYQHDINEKSLSNTLNDVVSECVSYVGVDINTASLSILKHVAGLTETKAEKIIEYRTKNGPFLTRKDLLNVPLIGPKTFQQCSGFIRIEPRSVGGKLHNLLDCTWVHPESYIVAKKIISKCNLLIKDIGSISFRRAIEEFQQKHSISDVATELDIPKERLEVVLMALQRELNQDYREEFDKQPLFKQGATSLSKLNVADVVTGAVTNVTHFGAFVDIGVECDGLIHTSKMRGMHLIVGDRVTATITELNAKRKRIGLTLMTKS